MSNFLIYTELPTRHYYFPYLIMVIYLLIKIKETHLSEKEYM
jgi:hypothetical protein